MSGEKGDLPLIILRKIAKIQSIMGRANAKTGKIPSSTPPSRKLANNVKQPARYPRVRLPQSPKKIEAGLLL
jgi:hypothetical protein